jgi:hypothetical protein
VLEGVTEVAEKVKGGRQWALMDDVFKELDAWDFPIILRSNVVRRLKMAVRPLVG